MNLGFAGDMPDIMKVSTEQQGCPRSGSCAPAGAWVVLAEETHSWRYGLLPCAAPQLERGFRFGLRHSAPAKRDRYDVPLPAKPEKSCFIDEKPVISRFHRVSNRVVFRRNRAKSHYIVLKKRNLFFNLFESAQKSHRAT